MRIKTALKEENLKAAFDFYDEVIKTLIVKLIEKNWKNNNG